MPAGRPLKYKTVAELQELIDAYFIKCDEKKRPYTITGLALALGTYRQTLCNYEERPEYLDAIKIAKARCENYAEELLLSGGNATGAIFALKNYDWTDKQEIHHTMSLEDLVAGSGE